MGITALPGGLLNFMGHFAGVGDSGNFWTSTRISTDPTSVSMYSMYGELMIMMSSDRNGLSVRCMKD
jgi:uncharacterized protein (TIGR02145 family)